MVPPGNSSHSFDFVRLMLIVGVGVTALLVKVPFNWFELILMAPAGAGSYHGAQHSSSPCYGFLAHSLSTGSMRTGIAGSTAPLPVLPDAGHSELLGNLQRLDGGTQQKFVRVWLESATRCSRRR